MIRGNESNYSNHFPYQACLIPNLPEEIQHQVRDITNHVVIPVNMLVAVMSFVCNSLIFSTVARTKSLQHPSLLMLCSLSISHLIWALYTLTENIYIMLDPHMCPGEGHEAVSLGILCYLATLSNMTMISRDRYLAICRPSWYRNHVNRSRAIKATALCWLASIATALASYTIFKIRPSAIQLPLIITFLFYMVCILLILFNYVRFFMANRRQSRIMQIHVRNWRDENEKKLTLVVSVIVLCFLFSVLPALILPLVLVSMGFVPLDPFTPFNSLLMTVNGLLNPLLNYGRNKDMRRAMSNTLRCYRRTRPLPSQHVTARNNSSTTESANIPLQELHF